MPVRLSVFFSRRQPWVLVSLVFGIVLLCYWPALQGALLWDDPAHVPRPDLRSWSGLGRIWLSVGATQQYYPVLFSAFWVEHQLWGDTTLGYHLVNVVLHTTSCCLFALVLQRLWSAPTIQLASNQSAPRLVPAGAAWFAALLFAVHPICVESVAWITEQKNTLSLVFYLLAGLGYLEFARHRRPGIYAVASGLFLLALGSKTATVTLPAALLVVTWWKNGRLEWGRDIRPLLPWFLAAVTTGLFTSWVERKWIGAEGVEFDLSIGHRIMLAGRIVWFYVGKLVWPADLNFFYPRWNVPAAAAGWGGYLGAAVALTVIGWILRPRSRGPLAGWLLFIGSLFPILGFFKVFFFIFSYVNDHFLYLASLAFIATATGGVALALARAPFWARRLSYALFALLLVTLGGQTYQQCQLYRDNVTLFQATIAKNPDSWMGHHILAFALAKLPDRHDEAIAQYRAALRLNPGYPDAHMGLAVELARTAGGKPEARAEYERALQLRPHYAEAHHNLAVELASLPDRLPEALEHGEQAVRLQPNFADAHAILANILAKMPGRTAEALEHYAESLRLKPDSAQAHHNLAYLLAGLPGRLAEALPHYEAALRLQPDYAEAHYNLANALAAIPGRGAEALSHYEKTLRLNPDSAMAHYNMGNTLAHLPGRRAEAPPHYEAALRLQPDFPDAQTNLANVLSALPGRESEALAHYEAALLINPRLPEVHYNLTLCLSRLPGRQADAIIHGEEAVRLKPGYLEAHNALAILYAQQNQLTRARTHWEQALQLDPKNEAVRQNLLLLERMANSADRSHPSDFPAKP